MGQTLSEPVTEKHTDGGSNARFVYAASAMQGWRISMEDAHTTELDATGDGGDGHAFFAVFDGHGGQNVARFAGTELHKRIVAHDGFASKDYRVAIKQGFLSLDAELSAHPDFVNDPSGCTAVTALFVNGHLFVGNAGDSRAVLSDAGEAVPMSFDHKPSNHDEQERIEAAGGFVEFGRVNGNLALSRALGDFEFKQNTKLPPEQQAVTANPDITDREIKDTDEFIIIACDGIWDCLSNEQAVDYVRRSIFGGKDLRKTCEEMMDHCLAGDSEVGGVGCDNMTVVIVGFLHGRTESEWYEWVANSYQQQNPDAVRGEAADNADRNTDVDSDAERSAATPTNDHETAESR